MLDVLNAILDEVFPPRCGGCRGRGRWYCDRCRAAVRLAPVGACRRCHRLVSVHPCPMCEAGEGPDSMLALARLEGPLREAIHRLKYGDRPQLAAPLVDATWQRARLGPGMLIPVPLHPDRRRTRGYNQAALLAAALGEAAGCQWIDGLRRRGPGGRQVGRGGDLRRRALEGAFEWCGAAIPDEIVLVDDVVTTGTTLLECARAAREAGVGRVDALAIALG